MSPRRCLVAFALVGTWLLAPIASAFPSGITGYSGKQGPTCGACHDPPPTLTLTVEGPEVVPAGMTASYVLTVDGTGTSGFNLAGSDGDFTVTDAGTRIHNGELTHTNAAISDAWSFDWTAPMTPGAHTLYAAAVRGNGTAMTLFMPTGVLVFDVEVSDEGGGSTGTSTGGDTSGDASTGGSSDGSTTDGGSTGTTGTTSEATSETTDGTGTTGTTTTGSGDVTNVTNGTSGSDPDAGMGVTSGTGSSDTGGNAGNDGSGCTCRQNTGGPAAGVWLLLVLGLRRRA